MSARAACLWSCPGNATIAATSARSRSRISASSAGSPTAAIDTSTNSSVGRRAAVDLTVVIDYGESIPTVSQKIRENVIKRIEGITGLRVTEVNVVVNDLFFPGDEQPESSRVA